VNSLENFQTIGRNGLHRYNNQDHAMLTGMYAVRNSVDGASYNLWSVNADEEYHEEIRESKDALTEQALEQAAAAFAKLDRFAFGIASGITNGILLFLATLILVLRGGSNAGLHLGLLSNYFPGYSVSVLGSFIGLGYGLLAGFILGWTCAFLRNTFVLLYSAIVRRRVERHLIQDFIKRL
jgi:hypothetical protein